MTSSPTPAVLPDARALPKLKPGYPDYVDDADGLARFREQVRHGSGHDMAICNNNSLGRLIDTIERLRAERDALATPPASDAAVPAGEGVWRERWYGSEPQRGSAIVDARGNLIVHFGGDRETHRLTTQIVGAHNAALAAAAPKVASELPAKPATKWRDPRPDRNCDYCGPGWKGAHKYKCPRAHEDNGEGGPVDD